MILQQASKLPYLPQRIISLVPSQTELLFYLGLDKEVIGITRFCIHPEAWFHKKPRIGGTKNINIEKIRGLQPDLIIANKEENIKEQIEELGKELPVLVTDISSLNDALQMITHIGTLTGKAQAAAILAGNINGAFKNLIGIENPVKTAYLIWQEPYMTVGGDTFISNMMLHCGFENIFLEKKRYPEVSIAQLQTADCKLLMLSSEPYPFEQKHVDRLGKLLPSTKIILVDGEMFSWYGSRLLQSAAYFNQLAAQFNP
jgi:ABC-type Fe3+-hydroxamate transport system substrate-binding protein